MKRWQHRITLAHVIMCGLMFGHVIITRRLSSSSQRRQERARAGAAGAPEGGDPQPAVGGRRGPRRPGQHALTGLLQGQEQAAQGPALRRVSGQGPVCVCVCVWCGWVGVLS